MITHKLNHTNNITTCNFLLFLRRFYFICQGLVYEKNISNKQNKLKQKIKYNKNKNVSCVSSLVTQWLVFCENSLSNYPLLLVTLVLFLISGVEVCFAEKCP